VAGYIVLGDRGSQFTSRRFVHARSRQEMVGSMGRVGDAATTPHEELLQSATDECPSPPPSPSTFKWHPYSRSVG